MKTRVLAPFLLLAFPLGLRGAGAQSAWPELVEDVQPGPAGSGPSLLTPLGSKLVFSADDGNGREPWVSDGSAAGTLPLGDLEPPGGLGPIDARTYGSRTYFSTVNKLWVTDGTPAGTLLLKDFVVSGTFPVLLGGASSSFYFAANDGLVGKELWKTDGTAAGTVLVKDLRPGPESSIGNSVGAYIAASLGAKLYFVADDGVYGEEVWETDGTAAGTSLVLDLYFGSGGSSPYFLLAFTGKLWLRGEIGQGPELIVLDLITGGAWATSVEDPGRMEQWGGEVYYSAVDAASGRELWKTDSVTLVSTMLGDLNPGPADSLDAFEPFEVEGTRIFFSADTAGFGEEPWSSDGTPGGTAILRDLVPGPGSSDPIGFVSVDGEVLFTARTGGRRELWRTDGTGAGTLPFWQINPSGDANVRSIVPNGPRVFCTADDGTAGQELFAFSSRLSGTSYCTAGTSQLGCVAGITADGVASRSEASGFTLRTTKAPGQKDGIFFFGTNGRQANPWGNGSSYQCVAPPVKRTPIVNGGGTSTKCNGSHGMDFNAWMLVNPSSAPVTGDVVQIQCWYRDPGNTSNQTTSLTNALEFTIYP